MQPRGFCLAGGLKHCSSTMASRRAESDRPTKTDDPVQSTEAQSKLKQTPCSGIDSVAATVEALSAGRPPCDGIAFTQTSTQASGLAGVTSGTGTSMRRATPPARIEEHRDETARDRQAERARGRRHLPTGGNFELLKTTWSVRVNAILGNDRGDLLRQGGRPDRLPTDRRDSIK